MGLTHGANERVIFLDGSENLVSIDPVRLGTAYNYKAVTTNQGVVDATANSLTWLGGTVRPLSPVNVRSTRNAAGDLFIQWERRSRVGAGMRPFSDVPLAEEREVYEIEAYNGATVVDTWRVVVSAAGTERPTWEIIKDTKHRVSVSNDGQVSISALGSAIGGDVLLLSRQRVYADESNLISFYAKSDFPSTLPRNVGLLSESSIVDDLTGVPPNYGWARGSVGQILTIEEFAFSDAISSGLASLPNTKLTIKTQNNQVSYYQDRIDDSTPPYLSTTALPAAASGAYRLYIRENPPNAANEVIDVRIDRLRMATYTAKQQALRFGSPQSSIKVRVYQVSGIVGRGAYWEATI